MTDEPLDRTPPASFRCRLRDRTFNLGAIVTALVLGALFATDTVYASAEPGALSRMGPDLVIGAVGCLALILRRHYPVVLHAAMLPFSLVSVSISGALIIAVFTVAVHRPWRTTAIAGALHAGTILAYYLINAEPRFTYLMAVLIALLTLALSVGAGLLLRSQRALMDSLRERARQAEAEQQARMEEVRRAERQRIAREAHDVLAHRISLLAIHAGALQYRKAPSSEEVTHAIGVIRRSAYQTLEDLRQVIGLLRDDAVEPAFERPQPRIADVKELIDESREAGMRLNYENTITSTAEVPSAVGRHAYRIVQEALTNARKHAPDARVRLRISGAPGEGVTVDMRNALSPGQLAPKLPGSGTGFVGLQERLDLVNGRIEVGATQEGDFRVWGWLPWPP